jgi:hypothetical protein
VIDGVQDVYGELESRGLAECRVLLQGVGDEPDTLVVDRDEGLVLRYPVLFT